MSIAGITGTEVMTVTITNSIEDFLSIRLIISTISYSTSIKEILLANLKDKKTEMQRD